MTNIRNSQNGDPHTPGTQALPNEIVDGAKACGEEPAEHITALAKEINAEYMRVHENIELLCRLCAKANTWPAADKAELRSLLDF
jgi:hypothetical protein